MIRDWTSPNIHQYGMDGGQEFLEDKLAVKRNQSAASKGARKIIHNCFTNINCYLMPEPGPGVREADFAGRLNQLSPQFIEILDEFCAKFLNPDELPVKVLNGQPLKGQQFGQYFESCANMFNNSDALPLASDMLQALNKAFDINLITQIKVDEYLSEMVIILSDKDFYEESELMSESDKLIDTLKSKFDIRKKSTDETAIHELTQMLTESLSASYRQKCDENDVKRKAGMNDTITKFVDEFGDELKCIIKSDDCLAENTLDKIIDTQIEHVVNKFKTFCSHDTDLYDNFKGKLKNQLENQASSFKTDNKRRIQDLKKEYDDNLALLKIEYEQSMSNLFAEPTKYYEHDELDHLSVTYQNDLLSKINVNTDHENIISFQNYIQSFDTYIASKLQDYQDKNQTRRAMADIEATKLIDELGDNYEVELDHLIRLGSCDTVVEFKVRAQQIQTAIVNEHRDKHRYSKGTGIPHLNLRKLNEKFVETLEDCIDVFNRNQVTMESNTQGLMERVIRRYRDKMNSYLDANGFVRGERLQVHHEELCQQVIKHFDTEKGHLTNDKFTRMVMDKLNLVFKSVQEENDKNTPTLPAIGIDLGTTNSCVAYYHPDGRLGKVIVLENRGKFTTPSVVEFGDTQPVVGDSAKNNILNNPRNIIYSVKRLIGRKFSSAEVTGDRKHWPFRVVDMDGDEPGVEVEVNGKSERFYPEDVSAQVLKKMKEIACAPSSVSLSM
ncbi:unnamed protein product [Oppiella nova]|uniref:Guanylate-binding protein N-terminal domain-containing protein n=1 Tax=Oppiella nova TaxID=334625 RepID=A0A7R9QEM3_9ACAR|nr:unnamed protein product [Oppiella nova]CAG2163493.1 unnamed protein product [Oppiella nova]